MTDSPTPVKFNLHPLLLLAVYLASGIAIASAIESPIGVAVAGVLVIAIASLTIRSYASFFLPLIFIPVGITCFQLELNSIADDRIRRMYSDGRVASGEPVEIEGVLIAFPEATIDGEFLRVKVHRLKYLADDMNTSGTVRLFVPNQGRSVFQYGDRVRVMCRLIREEQYRNPGVRSRVQTLDEQGIDATAVIKSSLLIEIVGSEPVFSPLAWVHQRRQQLIRAFNQSFSPSTGGVMIASLLGDKHFLDRETADVFRDGGTFHVLVISGLHITFIGGLTYWIVSLFTRCQAWRCILPTAFLWVYTIAVGAEIPVVRASLMFSVLLFARLIYRSSSLLNALGGCGLILLVWRPSDLFSASFQLTFVSVAAIVACAFPLIEKLRSVGEWHPTTETPLPPNVAPSLRRFCETLYWNENAWRIDNSRHVWSANLFKSVYLGWTERPTLQGIAAYLFEGLLVSFVVQLWMLPLLVIYFHRVSPSSLVLNLWVGLWLALESFSAVAALAVGALSSWLATPLIALTEFSNAAMMSLPSLLSHLGSASFRVPVYTGSAQLVYVFFTFAVVATSIRIFGWNPYSLAARRARLTSYGMAMMITTLVFTIVLHPFSSPAPDGKLTVDFLDVGQGDSALVTFPSGHTMLIDGGGQLTFSQDGEPRFERDRMRIGESVVSEFLWEKGHSRLDFVLATHEDADHTDGLVDVVRNFEIGTLILGDSTIENSAELREILRVADANGTSLKFVRDGDSLIIGRARVDFLNPESNSLASDNDRSVVARIAFGDRAFLLTGDIERRAETHLAKRDLRADVVKVPHHGSRTSSTQEFVEKVRPELAVISVGQRSRFGHPHREVVDRWLHSGAAVMTTGENGTITISTDGHALETKVFTP